MKTAYYIKDWQLKSVNAFMDIHGVDAGAEMLADFEKHGSLGKAMMNIAHKLETTKTSPAI